MTRVAATGRDRAPGMSGAILEIAPESGQRLDEGVFLVTLEGQLTPVNAFAAEMAEHWSNDDIEHFAAAVIEANAHGRGTIEELNVGESASLSRLQVVTLSLAHSHNLYCIVRSVSLERELCLALADSRKRYRDFAEMAELLSWETGPDGKFVYVSPAGGFGFSADDLLECDPATLMAERHDDHTNPFFTEEFVDQRDLWLWCRNGEIAPALLSARPLYAPDGTFIGARGICRDISDLRNSQSSSSETRWQLESVLAVTRALGTDGRTGLDRLAEILQRIFGADGAQFVLREHGVGPGDWLTIGKAGLSEATTSAQPFLDDALAAPQLVRIVSHPGWKILTLPLFTEGGRTGALLLWRRAKLGRWGEDHCALAGTLAPMLSGYMTRQALDLVPRALSAPADAKGWAAFKQTMERCMRRAHYDGRDGAVLSFRIVPHGSSDEIIADINARLVLDVASDALRASDPVGVLGGHQLVAWLDHIAEFPAQQRAAVTGAKIESALNTRASSGEFSIVSEVFYVTSDHPDDAAVLLEKISAPSPPVCF